MNSVKEHKGVPQLSGVALAVVAALSVALPAMAADEGEMEATQNVNELELGLGWLDESSRKFGQYTGLKEDGTYLIGNVDVIRRRADDPGYWLFRGTNLGLRSRNLRGEFGRQGSFRITAEYDQLPKYGPEALTIFEGAGGPNLTLPSGFVGLTPADTGGAGFAARSSKIDPFLRSVDLESERKNFKFGVGGELVPGWSAGANFRREEKEGTKLFGAVIGNSGGNPRSILAPEPIDYTTTEIEATVAYTSRSLQLRGGYYYSKFENAHDALLWQNPFNAINGWVPAAGFPTGFGQAALAPDNDYSRVSVNGGYNFDSHTRLSFNAEMGRMEQDEALLPYTVNPALSVTMPLPRDSAEARIDTTLFSVNLSAQPMRRLHLHAQYRYEDLDNKTPRDTFTYIGGDSTDQAEPGVTNRTRTNMPLSTTKNVFKLGGTYELMPRTKLKFAYDYDSDERTFSEVDKNETHLVMLGVRRSISDGLNGEISWSRSDRTGSEYCHNCPYLETYAPGFFTPQLENNLAWDNLPLLRRFAYADRERDKVRVSVTATPSDLVTVQLFADLMDDDYPESPFGLVKARTSSVTADLSITPAENVTAHAFYTRDRSDYDQWGRSFNAATRAALGFSETSPNDWFHSGEDRGDTFGLGGKVTLSKLAEVGLDLLHAKTKSQLNTETGPGLSPAGLPLPDLRTKMQRVKLYGTYKLRKDLTLKATYWYEKLETYDWQWDDFVPATMGNVITTGQQSPDYKVNFFGVSVIYRFF